MSETPESSSPSTTTPEVISGLRSGSIELEFEMTEEGVEFFRLLDEELSATLDPSGVPYI